MERPYAQALLETKCDNRAKDDSLWFANNCNDVSSVGTESVKARYICLLFGSVSANDLVIPKDDPLFGVARKEDGKLRPESCGLREDTLTARQHIGLDVGGGRAILLRHVPAVSHRGLTCRSGSGATGSAAAERHLEATYQLRQVAKTRLDVLIGTDMLGDVADATCGANRDRIAAVETTSNTSTWQALAVARAGRRLERVATRGRRPVGARGGLDRTGRAA
jgi:hypothetical protein